MAAEETRDGSSSGFLIDGKRYDIPHLDEITLDEERVLYIYADTVLSDFAPAHPKTSAEERRVYEVAQLRQVRNPDFKRALAHIAYKRENPQIADSDIQVAIGKASALEVDIALLRGDADPHQSSQKQPESESDTSKPSRSTDSGSPTESESAPPGSTPDATGTTESDTSSLALVETR